MPGSGALDRRVTFQARTLDDNGDALGDWDVGTTLWCQIQYLRGGEGVIQGRLQGRAPVVLTIRDSTFARSITTAWRAVTASGPAGVFNIRGAAPAKERGFIDLTAETGADD